MVPVRHHGHANSSRDPQRDVRGHAAGVRVHPDQRALLRSREDGAGPTQARGLGNRSDPASVRKRAAAPVCAARRHLCEDARGKRGVLPRRPSGGRAAADLHVYDDCPRCGRNVTRNDNRGADNSDDRRTQGVFGGGGGDDQGRGLDHMVPGGHSGHAGRRRRPEFDVRGHATCVRNGTDQRLARPGPQARDDCHRRAARARVEAALREAVSKGACCT
mmetsp:Transcript_66714/g.152928  ORF Transcript_66714/g.152928 Transcript_66714/m.152928 type:complete len:218 (-) Transcript_66714:7-660(-)